MGFFTSKIGFFTSPARPTLECVSFCVKNKHKKGTTYYSGPYLEVNGKTRIYFIINCYASPRTRAASEVVRRSR